MDTDNINVSPGFLPGLPRLYSQAGPQDGVLRQVTSAVSLATLSDQVGAEKFHGKARKEYGKALVMLREAISGGQLMSDSTVGGVLCLNMYDV